MHPQTIEIEIPEAIAEYLRIDNIALKSRIETYLLADLVQQGAISFGKAAELAGTDKMSFILHMGRIGIPYYNGTISEVLEDAETVRQTMKD